MSKKLMSVFGLNVEYLEQIEQRVCWNLAHGVSIENTIDEFNLSKREKEYLVSLYKDVRKMPKVSEKDEG